MSYEGGLEVRIPRPLSHPPSPLLGLPAGGWVDEFMEAEVESHGKWAGGE